LGFVLVRFLRGRKRGFAAELLGTLSIWAALLIGGGLFHWSERLVTTAATISGHARGLIGMIGIFIATIIVWRKTRRAIQRWAEARLPSPEQQRRWGGLAAVAQALGVGALLFLLASTIPVGEFRKPFTRGSVFGRVVMKVIRPAYLAQTAASPTR
ncbi:MAG: CvpA family protein, partial [Verrucomicrobiae bacterium]|nr:CvpA family protein [Verrucomicrobiae bacterium]